MRNVFFMLLFANLAYFGWAHWVDKPQPPPVNEAVARLPRLKLASELPPSRARSAKPEKTALNEPARCMSVGPFTEVENSVRAADLLRAKGFSPRQRAEPGASLQQYWVYVGGLKTDAQAESTLSSLKRLGFKDAEVMTDGGDPGRRVSLGLFNDRAGAEQRVWAARLKGFHPEIAEQRQPATVYWVDLTTTPGVSAVSIGELFTEGVNSRIAVQPCTATSPQQTTSATPAQQPATAAISKVP